MSEVVVLNAGEQGLLDRCEATIARGLDTFVQVGEALMEIRERRLYKAYGTFDDYCQERWSFTRQRASQLIQAAEVSGALSTNVDRPASEAVARALRPVMRPDSTEKVEEVWAEVVEGHGPKPTAAQVREVVERRNAPVSAVRAQERVVSGLAEKARRIIDLEHHLDLEVVKSIDTEEREQWEQQLRSARTVLSRAIEALSSAA